MDIRNTILQHVNSTGVKKILVIQTSDNTIERCIVFGISIDDGLEFVKIKEVLSGQNRLIPIDEITNIQEIN